MNARLLFSISVLTGCAFLFSLSAAEPNRPPTPEWIWTALEAKDNEVAFFRKTFEARPDVLKAILLGACGNKMVVFLNGQRDAEIGMSATKTLAHFGFPSARFALGCANL